MKNVRPNQLKKCIYLDGEEFETILHELFGNSISLVFNEYGVSIFGEDSEISFDELATALAEYFDVGKVESFHTDNIEYPGVWVVYAEKDAES